MTKNTKNNPHINVAQKHFDFLMTIIDNTCNADNDTRNGQFYYLENSDVAQLTMSKHQKSTINSLKAFLCNRVLVLTSGNTELNFSEYERFFKGTNTKSYFIDVENLNALFDKKATLTLSKEKFNWEYIPTTFPNNFSPLLLLERLCFVAYESLQEYLSFEDIIEDSNKSSATQQSSKEIQRQKTCTRRMKQFTKSELYYRFTMAVCLYELFMQALTKDYLIKHREKLVSPLIDFSNATLIFTEVCNSIHSAKTPNDAATTFINAVNTHTEKLVQTKNHVMLVHEQNMVFFYHISHLITFCTVIAIIEYETLMHSDQVPKKLKKGYKSIFYIPNYENTTASSTTWSVHQTTLFSEDAKLNKASTKQYEEFLEQIKEIDLLQELWVNLKTPNAPLSHKEQFEQYIQKKEKIALLLEYFQKVQSGITKDDLSWNLQATDPTSQMSAFMELVMTISRNS